MAQKTDRQRLILKLVSTNKVHNQDELQALLEEWGMNVTQATLSRDVNELGLMKYRSEDGSLCYRRRIQDSDSAPATTSDGVLSIEFTGNMAVMKTHPGFASVIASSLDRSVLDPVAGTVAGDDTILIVLRQPVEVDYVLDALSKVVPDIKDKLC